MDAYVLVRTAVWNAAHVFNCSGQKYCMIAFTTLLTTLLHTHYIYEFTFVCMNSLTHAYRHTQTHTGPVVLVKYLCFIELTGSIMGLPIMMS